MSYFDRKSFPTRDIMNIKDINGAQPIIQTRTRLNNRDPLAVDDIAGAAPPRLVGYTGSRPDMILQKEAQLKTELSHATQSQPTL